MANVGSKQHQDLAAGDRIIIKHGRGERLAEVKVAGRLLMVRTFNKSQEKWGPTKRILFTDYLREWGKA